MFAATCRDWLLQFSLCHFTLCSPQSWSLLTALLIHRIVFRHPDDVYAMLQPIRVQTAQGNVEEALVHVAELGADVADTRATAVHNIDPMHTMIFTAQGTLLHANKAALESLCQHSISGETRRHSLEHVLHNVPCDHCIVMAWQLSAPVALSKDYTQVCTR